MKSFYTYCLCGIATITTLSGTSTSSQLHRYCMANFYQAAGNVSKAHSWYNQLVNNEIPTYAYKGYLSFLNTTGQHNHIYALLPKVDALLPHDPEVQLIFSQILEKAGKEEDAHTKVLVLSQRFPLHEEICYAAAQIYIKRHEPENAITILDTLLNGVPRKQNTFIFMFTKAIAQLALEKKELAFETVKKSLDLQPNFDRGWLLYGSIAEQLGKRKETIEGYTKYQQLSGKKAIIEHHVQRLKEHKKPLTDSEDKKEQQTIFEMATLKHTYNNLPLFLNDFLAKHFSHRA